MAKSKNAFGKQYRNTNYFVLKQGLVVSHYKSKGELKELKLQNTSSCPQASFSVTDRGELKLSEKAWDNIPFIKNSKSKGFRVKVAEMVAECYIPNPLKCTEVTHRDGNTRNVALGNLEWDVTTSTLKKAKPKVVQMVPVQKSLKLNNTSKTFGVRAANGESFRSIEEAATSLNLPVETVKGWCDKWDKKQMCYYLTEEDLMPVETATLADIGL